jgi:hypothetical protein
MTRLHFQKFTFFNASYIWLVLDCGHFDRTLEYTKTLPLNVVTDMIITNSSSDTKDLELYDVYHTGFERGGIFNCSHVGKWTHPESRTDRDDLDLPRWMEFFVHVQALRRADLQGLVIRTVTLTEGNSEGIDTHQYLSDDLKPHVDTMFKMNYQMIRILKLMNNFTWVFCGRCARGFD